MWDRAASPQKRTAVHQPAMSQFNTARIIYLDICVCIIKEAGYHEHSTYCMYLHTHTPLYVSHVFISLARSEPVSSPSSKHASSSLNCAGKRVFGMAGVQAYLRRLCFPCKGMGDSSLPALPLTRLSPYASDALKRQTFCINGFALVQTESISLKSAS